jgi:tRNA(Ile)-lysidine synthase
VPRARLLALLTEARQPFLRDPSNLNPVFERARMRLAPEISRGSDRDAIVAELHAKGRQRIERERLLDRLIAGAVALHPAGFAVLNPAAFKMADPERAERLLGRVVATIGAARYPARLVRLGRLRAGLLAAPDRARTLGGCRFVPWRGRLLVLRELAAASPPVPIEPGMHLVWDRRFAVDLAVAAPGGFMLGYVGQRNGVGVERPPAQSSGDGDGDLPRLVRPVLPALWDGEGLAAVPHLGYRRRGLGTLPRLSFRPANPLTGAGFTVV